MGQTTSRSRQAQRDAIVRRAALAIIQEESSALNRHLQHAIALHNGAPQRASNRQVRVAQMRRGGLPFTKADLVELAHQLTGETPERAALATIEELCVVIRLALYASAEMPLPQFVDGPRAAAALEPPPEYMLEEKHETPLPSAPSAL